MYLLVEKIFKNYFLHTDIQYDKFKSAPRGALLYYIAFLLKSKQVIELTRRFFAIRISLRQFGCLIRDLARCQSKAH